jgi:glycerophosphoryl diester phosphodiesterase
MVMKKLYISSLLICLMTVSAYADDCGDWGYLEMDFDTNCYVDLGDFSKFASTIVAHRGYSAIAPENTIISCNASRNYAGMVEFDVRTTDDQQLVLMHDSTVDRTTDGTGTVEAMTYSDIRSLDAGSWYATEFTGELVPTLHEAVLAVLPDMAPCIERKSGTADQYLAALNALRCKTDVVVISFDRNFLADLEELDSTIATGALGSGSLTTAIINDITAKGIDFVDWSHTAITTTEVGMVHSADLELWVWTVNDMNRVQELIDMGVDGITTDRPEDATQILEQQ